MNITSQHIKNQILAKAKELGFLQAGFAKYEILEEESARLKAWLAEGMQADMGWIEKGFEKRRDVRQIIPEAKSVISLAYNYYTPLEHDESKPKISRYAWGKDYHKLLKPKLKELCEHILLISNPTLNLEKDEGINTSSPACNSIKDKTINTSSLPCNLNEDQGINTSPPAPLTADAVLLKEEGRKAVPVSFNTISGKEKFIETSPHSSTKGRESYNVPIMCRAYVDDGPVMDKVWAQRAGIGWMGKHTNIINPDFGSWFFLCEIITNIEFDNYDTPMEDLCGSCSLCISACPTGAITNEYVVDANKCISYQTIENGGEIPPDIDLDGWIFGCDVCQDVCPYNSPKYNHVTEEQGFWPISQILTSPPAHSPERIGGTGNTSETQFASLEELDSITESEFSHIFSQSPVKRTKFKGWKRNLERFKY